MKRLNTSRAAVVAVVGLVMTVVALVFVPPAHANGDYHEVAQKTEPWSNRFLVNIPFSSYMQHFQVTVKLDYYRWFDHGVDKIAPFGWVGCWRTPKSQGPPTGGFQSLTLKLGYVDSTVAKGPFTMVVPGKHVQKLCEAEYIPVKKRIWMPVKDHPAWYVEGTFDYLNGFTHKHIPFHMRWQHNGKTYDIRAVQPSNDPTISRIFIHTDVPNIGGA